MNCDLSIVVPSYNEAESLGELVAWIERVMKTTEWSYEVIIVDDGSQDDTISVVTSLSQADSRIKCISFRRNYGKSAALNVGFEATQGNVVITMDADLQDSPDEIPALMNMILNEGYDMVSGWKKVRHDPISKTLPSKLFNNVVRRISGIQLHDFNCGLKAYRSNVVKSVEVYGEMHRYIPLLAKEAGFNNIGEKVVHHQKRKYGKSKFGLNRFINGYLDLISLWFLQKFGRKPMHLFGVGGSLMFLIGIVISIWIIIKKLILQAKTQADFNSQGFSNIRLRAVTDQPLFFIALLVIIIGVMLFLTGFIAELISRNSLNRNQYQIKKKI